MAFQAPKKLVFLHIPKTAGSSVGAWLDGHFEEDEIARIYSGKARAQLATALADPKVRFIRGHFGLYAPLLAELENPDIFVFTVLRNPVDRVISLYNHMQRRQSEKHNARLLDVSSLRDFLDIKTDFNEQTRYLSGIEDKKTFRKSLSNGYDQAVIHSAKFDFIAFTETLNEDLELLAKKLGFKEKKMPHKNKGLSTIKQIVLNALYSHSISKVEVWDIKLYELLKNKTSV